MANADTERELLRAVASSFPQSADRLRGQVETLASLTSLQNERIRENTDAVTQNTGSRGTGSSVANASRSILSTIGGGLFLSPLINGIARLFRGSSNQEVEPLTPATRPTPMNLEAGLFSNRVPTAFDFDQFGKPRGIGPAGLDLASLSAAQQRFSPDVSAPYTDALNRPTGSAQTNVTIQIQALDSRSILDRSDDIARALREAVLHSHSVNDVINEG